jgi:Ca2+-binding EF-hand superfamily protein
VADKLLSRNANLSKLFASFDTDLSGTVDYSEMQKGLKSMGVDLTDRELDAMIEVAGEKIISSAAKLKTLIKPLLLCRF